MKLTVVIVSYNVRYFLEQCIISVQRACKDLEYEIYVVDNDSSDDTVDYITRRFGDAITLIESQHNLGFARANNIAIRQTESQYVLLLNPDTFVGEDSIRTVIDFMDAHPKAGGVGVMMHNPDGTVARESRRGLPTPWVSLLKMLGKSKRYYMSHLPWDEPAQIEVMSGAFCMLRREALDQVGLLDEDFFMYGEDIDLSYRIMKGGFENWYVPAKIVHYKGESTHKTSFRYVHVFYQAMAIFFRKHYGHLSILVTLPIHLAIYMRAFIALIHMQGQRIRESLGLYARRAAEVDYAFAGSTRMQTECRKLAKRKGLQGRFGFSANEVEMSEHTCLVYDSQKYSFDDIIADARQRAGRFKCIGTYNSDTRLLITPNDIFR